MDFRRIEEDETNSCVSENENAESQIELEEDKPTSNNHNEGVNSPDENHSFSNSSDKSSLFFDDQIRSVDYVLAWKELVAYERDDRTYTQKDIHDMEMKEKSRSEKRETFEENLIHEGLELERSIVDGEIHFVKIHAPLEVLRRYAEILKLRLPMKEVSRS